MVTREPLHPFPSLTALEGRQLQMYQGCPLPMGQFLPTSPRLILLHEISWLIIMSGLLLSVALKGASPSPPVDYILQQHPILQINLMRIDWDHLSWQQLQPLQWDSCTGSGNQDTGTSWLGSQFPFLTLSKKVLFLRANHHLHPRYCPMEEVDSGLEVNISLCCP